MLKGHATNTCTVCVSGDGVTPDTYFTELQPVVYTVAGGDPYAVARQRRTRWFQERSTAGLRPLSPSRDSWMRTAEVRARICHVGGFRQRYTDTESIGSLTPLLYHAPYNVGSLLSAQILAPVAVVDIILGYLLVHLCDDDISTLMPGFPSIVSGSGADWWIFYYDGETYYEQQQRLERERERER